jgi:hypothetical protein
MAGTEAPAGGRSGQVTGLLLGRSLSLGPCQRTKRNKRSRAIRTKVKSGQVRCPNEHWSGLDPRHERREPRAGSRGQKAEPEVTVPDPAFCPNPLWRCPAQPHFGDAARPHSRSFGSLQVPTERLECIPLPMECIPCTKAPGATESPELAY